MRRLAVIAVALLAGACSSSHTTSTTSRSASAASTTTSACRAGQPVEIFFKLKAGPLQVLAVRAQLQHDPTVTGVHFIDHNDAYLLAKKLFARNPDQFADVKPSDLPESFRATTRPGTDPHDLATRYAGIAGVASVNFPRTAGQRCG